jgi:hypothetical protein
MIAQHTKNAFDKQPLGWAGKRIHHQKQGARSRTRMSNGRAMSKIYYSCHLIFWALLFLLFITGSGCLHHSSIPAPATTTSSSQAAANSVKLISKKQATREREKQQEIWITQPIKKNALPLPLLLVAGMMMHPYCLKNRHHPALNFLLVVCCCAPV